MSGTAIDISSVDRETVLIPPRSQPVVHEYTVHRNVRGYWVASETHGLAEGVFFTREEAWRFALREADGDASRVRLDSADAVPAT